MIELKKVENIMKLMTTYQVEELEITDNHQKIRLVKKRGQPPTVENTQPVSPVQATNKQESQRQQQVITSPFVGTFYRSPSPGADPFVEVGQTVKKGEILCIIEAMKLMNEIEAETGGRVAEILIDNGTAVEFDQPLIILDTSFAV